MPLKINKYNVKSEINMFDIVQLQITSFLSLCFSFSPSWLFPVLSPSLLHPLPPSCQVMSKPASHLAWQTPIKQGPLLWGWQFNNSIGINLMRGGEKPRGLPDVSWVQGGTNSAWEGRNKKWGGDRKKGNSKVKVYLDVTDMSLEAWGWTRMSHKIK